ncbi:MAG: N-acetylmuramoyl-L-alanine amidase [Spirochaetaceae bacterium]|nr:N-acetylmuramoyl-L-alanine amidase [Spirochaetaceae bacterium]
MRRVLASVLLFYFCGGALFGDTTTDAAGASASAALSVDQTLAALNAALSWDPFFKSGMLISRGHIAVFCAVSLDNAAAAKSSQVKTPNNYVIYDGGEIFVLQSPYLKNGNLLFPQTFVSSLKQIFDRSELEDSSHFRIAAIIIDPGHGGKDEGASGEHIFGGKKIRLVEKNITLNVSRRLYASLKRCYPDKKVLITREGDTFPTLEDRVVQANSVPLKDNEAIIYISVHANASLNKNARGFEVWYLSPEHRRQVLDKTKYTESNAIMSIFNSMLEEEFTTESIEMAKAINERFKKDFSALMPSRGLKAEEWYVVRKARMPSVLIELGFVTNADDALLLSDDAYLQKISLSIYNGIVDFVSKFESWNSAS